MILYRQWYTFWAIYYQEKYIINLFIEYIAVNAFSAFQIREMQFSAFSFPFSPLIFLAQARIQRILWRQRGEDVLRANHDEWRVSETWKPDRNRVINIPAGSDWLVNVGSSVFWKKNRKMVCNFFKNFLIF